MPLIKRKEWANAPIRIMIVCKITIDLSSKFEYNAIFDKLLSLGDFILSTTANSYEVYYSSDYEDIDAEYVRKTMRKLKIDCLVHEFSLDDKYDFESYVNQWVVTNLDRQLKLKIEREQQPELQKIKRRLDLLDQVVDEMINARDRYIEQAQLLQQKQAQKDGVEKAEPSDTPNN